MITPFIKGRGLDKADRKNYMPISNLTFVSKIVKLVLSLQLTAFLEASNVVPVNQNVYMKYHSTESALLKVYSDLCLALEGKGHLIILELLDLSAAFDTFDYDILLKCEVPGNIVWHNWDSLGLNEVLYHWP